MFKAEVFKSKEGYMARVLKPDGSVLIEQDFTPNAESFGPMSEAEATALSEALVEKLNQDARQQELTGPQPTPPPTNEELLAMVLAQGEAIVAMGEKQGGSE